MSPRRLALCALIVLSPALIPTAASAAAFDPQVGDLSLWQYEEMRLNDRTTLKVNVAGGNLLLRSRDVTIPGTGLPLQFGRTYNNLDQALLGDFGHGQIASIGRMTDVDCSADGQTITFQGPTGEYAKFTRTASGGYTSPTGYRSTLTRNADSTFAMRWHSTGIKFNFQSCGDLTSVVDQNSNKVDVAYDASSKVTSITDTQGRKLTFAYNANGDITSVSDPTGRCWTYGYTGRELTQYTDPAGGVTRYTYTSGNLTKITDPRGNATTITHDASRRVTKIVRITDAATGSGPATSFTYNAGNTVVTDPRGNRTTFHYDAEGRVLRVVNAAGNEASNQYDSDSNVIKFTDAFVNPWNSAFDTDSRQTGGEAPTGLKFSASYAAQSQTKGPAYYYPTSSTNTEGDTTDFSYDTKGNVTSAVDRATQRGVQFTYNANGTVATARDGAGNTTSYAYDAKGNLTRITPPAPLGPTTFTYDGLSRVLTRTDGKGQVTTYTYDVLDRLTRLAVTAGPTVSYSYDQNGNTTQRVDPTGTTVYTYDALNRQTRKTQTGLPTLSYSYDVANNLTAFSNDLGSVTYAYNNLNLLSSLAEPGGFTTTFTYDKSYNRTETSYPNGVKQTAAFDTSNRMTSIGAKNAAGQQLTAFSYTYKVGTGPDRALRQSMTDSVLNETTSYSYDSFDRLTRALIQSGTATVRDYRYAFDAAGNRTREQELVAGTDITSTFNAANELVTRAGRTYSYDANGNTLGHDGGFAVTYNKLDQSTTVLSPGQPGPETWTYAGTGQWERVKAQTPADGDFTYTTSLFGVGGMTGTLGWKEHYVRDPGGTPVSVRHANGERGYYLFDALGSVVAVTRTDGTVGVRYRYDPYGNDRGTTGTFSNRLRFVGQYFDSLGLYHMGARLYRPEIGRWTQQDPLGRAGDLREGNRYIYVSGDPVNLVDPLGTFSIGIDVEAEIGPVRVSAGVSVDDDGDVGVSAGGGGGTGVGGGIKGTVNPFGEVEDGGEIEGGGCVGPGVAACYSASSKGGASAGVGGGAEAGIAYRHTKKVADLW